MNKGMSKAAILVVEDDWDLSDALSSTLEMAGFEVQCAASAEQALELLADRLVDMVITDLGVFTIDRKAGGMTLIELAPDVTLDEITKKTEAKFTVDPKLKH